MSVRHLSAPAAGGGFGVAWSEKMGREKGASHVRELVSVSRNIMGLDLGLGWVSVENGLVYAFQYSGVA